MRACIDGEADVGLVRTRVHGEAQVVLGTRAYPRSDRSLAAERAKRWGRFVSFPAQPGEDLPVPQHGTAAARAAGGGASYRRVKRRFGYI